jgi:hypothetical protein
VSEWKGKQSWQRKQAVDDATATANWSWAMGHAKGCTVTRRYSTAMSCCLGREDGRNVVQGVPVHKGSEDEADEDGEQG